MNPDGHLRFGKRGWSNKRFMDVVSGNGHVAGVAKEYKEEIKRRQKMIRSDDPSQEHRKEDMFMAFAMATVLLQRKNTLMLAKLSCEEHLTERKSILCLSLVFVSSSNGYCPLIYSLPGSVQLHGR